MRAVSGRLRTLGLVALLLVSDAHARPTNDKQRAALELYDKATASYTAGLFEQSAELLKRAYALYPDPIILYNLARALESGGDLTGALDAYRRYLGPVPKAADRQVIERRIATISAQLEEREALRRRGEEQRLAAEHAAERERKARAQEAEAIRQSESAQAQVRELTFLRRRRQARARLIASWSLAGIGAAGLAAGGALGAFSQSRRADAVANPISLDAERQLTSAQGLALGANISFGVGGALAAVGVIWGSVEIAKQRRAERSTQRAAR